MTLALDTGYAGHRAATGYRVALAAWLPALQLAYTLLLWPLMTYDPAFDELGMATTAGPPDTVFNKLVPPLIFLASVAIFLAERPRVPRHMRLHIGVVLAFWGVAAASYLWSIQPAKVMTEIVRFAMIYTSIALGCLVARSMEQVLKPVALVLGVTIAANVLAVAALPPTPIGHAGIYGQKNLLGLAAALALVFAIGGIDRRRWRQSAAALLAVGACLLLLVVSLSKTAILLALVAPAIAGAFVVARRFLRIPFAVALTLTVLLAWFAFSLANAASGFSTADISMLIGGEPTFTGRTSLWEFAATMIAERPLLGHGFNSFWQIGLDSPALHMPYFVGRASHGHNGYVDMLLHLGLVGLCLHLLVVVSAAAGIDRALSRSPRIGFAMASLLVFLCLRELLESNILTALAPGAIVFALLQFLPLADKKAEHDHVR